MGVKPIDLREIEKHSPNVYEAVIVAGKKARNLNNDYKIEFNSIINTMLADMEDEIDDRENPDILRVSFDFETRMKPHLKALQDLLGGNLKYSFKEQAEKNKI